MSENSDRDPHQLVTIQAQGEDNQDQAEAAQDIPITAHTDCETANHWRVAVPSVGLQTLAEGQKGGCNWGEPVFTWKEGSLITLEDMHSMLGVLLDTEHPKIT
jgi:hypothetical protein